MGMEGMGGDDEVIIFFRFLWVWSFFVSGLSNYEL